MLRLKSFTLELENLDNGDTWLLAQVWHEAECVYFVLAETGAFVRLEDLTPADRKRVERDLAFWLEAA